MSYTLANIQRLPTNPGIDLIDRLNGELNDQADRIESLFSEVGTIDQAIPFTEVLHWRERARYLRSVGQGKKAAALEKAEALKEAKAADQDDEFMEGYQQFLATEFDSNSQSTYNLPYHSPTRSYTMNNWTPKKLKIPRVNWTLERAKSYRLGGGCKQSTSEIKGGVSNVSYKR